MLFLVIFILLILCVLFIIYHFYFRDKFDNSNKINSCYYYKTINTTNKPILSNLDLTLVLSMENNNRFIKNKFILNLAPKTIIQFNKGFKKCIKDCNGKKINSSWTDLNHANLSALEKYKNKYKNILILEDDAELLDDNINKWNEVNNFLLNKNFITLSIGNQGLLFPSISNFKRNMWFFGASHAVFYNLKKINNLIDKVKYNKCSQQHWDKILGKNYNITKFKIYRYPLIVQKFPQTDNRKEWHKNKSPFINNLLNKIDNSFFKAFKLDKNIKGWKYTNILWNYWYIIIFIIIMIIILIKKS